MPEFIGPDRIISYDDTLIQLCTSDIYPDRFSDVYTFSKDKKHTKIILPKYVSYETEDIEQHKILIYLLAHIVAIRENNYRAKHEDDILDEITAYHDTLMHFGTDDVVDYIDETAHCAVLRHFLDLLKLYTYNGFHDPHPNLHAIEILRRDPGKLFIAEIII